MDYSKTKSLLISLFLILAATANAAVNIDGIEYEFSADEAAVKGSKNAVVDIPPTVNYNGKTYEVTSIAKDAFHNNTSLIEIIIPNSISSIEDNAFFDCENLKKVIIPDIEAWCKIKFGRGYYNYSNPLYYVNHLFIDENTEIIDLIIPEGIETIPDGAFQGCFGIKTITLPKTLKSIGEAAFEGCAKGSVLTIPNSVTEIRSWAFSGPEKIILNSNNVKHSYKFSGVHGQWIHKHWIFIMETM